MIRNFTKLHGFLEGTSNSGTVKLNSQEYNYNQVITNLVKNIITIFLKNPFIYTTSFRKPLLLWSRLK